MGAKRQRTRAPGRPWAFKWSATDGGVVWKARVIEEWVAAYRLVPGTDGLPVVAELRIHPSEPGPHNIDQWSGNPESVPAGGLTARLLRRVPLGRESLELRDVIEKFRAEGFTDQMVDRLLGQHGMSVRGFLRKAPSRPGRRGRDDVYYAELALQYRKAIDRNSTTPVLDVAKELEWSPAKVRDAIHDARRRGLLTSSGPGRPGGELTPKAQAVLKDRLRRGTRGSEARGRKGRRKS